MKQTKTKNLKKTSNLKMILGGFGLTTVVAATTLGAAACAVPQTGQTIIDKGNGSLFASNELGSINYSLEDGVKNALSNPDGTNALFTAEYHTLLMNIIENFTSGNIVLENQVQEERDRIDEEYQTLLDDIGLDGRDREIAIQKELDTNGGTEESWKRQKLIDWGTTFLSERLFNNDYSNILNVTPEATTVLGSPDRSVITQALANKVNKVTTGPQLGFGAKPNDSDGLFSQEFVQGNVALQEKVFNLYIQDEKPFVATMNLWKHSTDGVGSAADDVWINVNPVSGGTDEEGNPLPPPAVGGTYATPYFTDERTADNTLTPVEKFTNFNNANISKVPNVTESLANFTPLMVNGVDNTKIGLKDKMNPTWTDDSSNFILVEPKTWNLVNEFMLASLALFNLDNGIQTSLATKNVFQSTPGKFISNAVINEEFDLISRSFMSSTKPLNVNSAIIKNDNLRRILNQNNPNLTSLINSTKDIWSVDAFHSNDPNTNEFIYLRNEFGVHAISLDGWSYIKTGITFQDRVSKAGDIVLYRSIQNKENSSDLNASTPTKTFAVPLNQNLKTYYDANLVKIWTSIFEDFGTDPLASKIVTNFLGSNTESQIFNKSEISLFKSLYQYLDLQEEISNVNTRNTGLNATKEVFSASSGVNSFKNGIASPYIFGQQTSGSFNEVLMFLNNGNKLDEINGLRTIYSTLINNIDAYIIANEEVTKPLVSMASSFPFSQTILVNSRTMNQVLKGLTTNTDYYSNTLTNQAVEQATLFGETKVMDIMKLEPLAPVGATSPLTFDLSIYGFSNTQLTDFNFQMINNLLGSSVSQTTLSSNIRDYVDLANPNVVSLNEIQTYKQALFFKDTYSSNVNYQSTKENLLMFTLGLNSMLEDVNGDGVFGDRFLTRIKSELSTNEAANFTWWNNFSRPLVPATTLALIDTSQELLMQNPAVGSTIFLNQNNNVNSQYSSNNGTFLTPENANGIFDNVYQNTGYGQTNSFTYNPTKDDQQLSGFIGLQTENETTIPEDLKEFIFPTGQRQTGGETNSLEGVLYQYGSRQSLLDIIRNDQNVTEINALASSLRNKIDNPTVTNEVQKVLETSSLATKRLILEELVNNVILIPELVFNNYTGYANGNKTTGELIPGNDNFTSYGAFIQQVNFQDMNFQKDLNGNVIMVDNVPSEIKTIDQLASNIGSSLMLDLLVEFSMESATQTVAFNNIGRNNQFTIYDANTRNALGEIWVKNFDLE